MVSIRSQGLGGRIFQARLNLAAKRGAQVSQQNVADGMGVHQKTVANWERGAKEPDLETIERLARFLETTPEYLAFGVEQPRPQAERERPDPRKGKGQ